MKKISYSLLSIILLAIASFSVCASDQAQPQPQAADINSPTSGLREYHLKGAFLRYVASFVEWPPGALPEDRINICVIGQLPNFQGINSIDGKVVQSRPLAISKIVEPYEAKDRCQLLFVSQTEEPRIDNIITTLNGLPIVSFGDMAGFAAKGGNMNFYIVNNRLAIMINPVSVKKSNLTINQRMLKVVTVVPNLPKE